MRKFIFVVLIGVFGSVLGQNASLGILPTSLIPSVPKFNVDIGLYYSQFQANNENYDRHNDKDWYNVGIYMGAGAYNISKYRFFIDLGVDISWHKSVFMTNVPIALNAGVDIISLPKQSTYLTAHIGIGYYLATLRKFDDGMIGGFYVYDDEHLEQHSAYVPAGVRFYHKHFFADFTYRLRFWKSKVRVKIDESNEYYFDDDDFYKANKYSVRTTKNNRIRDIETTPWTFTIGVTF